MWGGGETLPRTTDMLNSVPLVEAQEYKDENIYVNVDGQWLKASARFYCEHLFDHDLR